MTQIQIETFRVERLGYKYSIISFQGRRHVGNRCGPSSSYFSCLQELFFFFLKLKRQIKMVDYLMQSTQIFVVLINSGNLNCGFV